MPTKRTTRKTNSRYAIKHRLIGQIKPSPENDQLYGQIEHDQQMQLLIDSIRRHGLDQPLTLTADGFILSGHRRFYAVQSLGWKTVPVQVRREIRRDGNSRYHQELVDFNPQRIKQAGSLLREALLRDQSAEDTYNAIQEHRRASVEVDADFMQVPGRKEVPPVTEKKEVFLHAVQKVIEDLADYHPLEIRQIHYRLLNDPPLTSTPNRSKFDVERYRYQNDKACYNALVRLLRSARYHGHVSMSVIDDPTRPQVTHLAYSNVSEFVQDEVDDFLIGYERDRQQDQPRHVEIFGEKNTLMGILRPIAREYHVPLSIGRGFCSTPVWRDISQRFHRSGKERMTLIIVSDFDPSGFYLAEDAIRTLRDLWEIPIDGHRIAVTREQIEEMGLAEDFNPAKDGSPGARRRFVERTGSDRTWEVEALPPEYLAEQVKAAIESNMNMELYEKVVAMERNDCDELYVIKQDLADSLNLW